MKFSAFLSTIVAAGLAAPAAALDKSGIIVENLPIEFDPVAAVPEPASWATMIIGFAVIGIVMRARQAARAKA